MGSLDGFLNKRKMLSLTSAFLMSQEYEAVLTVFEQLKGLNYTQMDQSELHFDQIGW